MTLPVSSGRAALISVTVVLATIMQTLDSTIANVALPHMQGALNAAQDQISWVVTSYVVASAIGLALTSYAAERFGRKRMLTVSIVGFTAASVLCGAAQSLPQIVGFRLIQGFCGAGLVPLAQAVLMDLYPREKQGQAMAVWGMGVMVGPIVGPTLGGYLTEYYNWRWVFLINLPFGILAALGIGALLPETERRPNQIFDMKGFVFLAVGISALQLMLDRGQTLDWFAASEIVIEAGVAVLGFYLFVVHILTTEHPFISAAPFRDINYIGGLVLMFLMGAVPLATMVLIPTLLQSVMGYPVLDAGWVMAPRGLGTMFAMAVMGRSVARVDARLLLAIGLALSVVALWQMSTFTLDSSAASIGWSGFVQGVGMGMLFVPMSSLAFGTLEKRYVTEAASLYHLVRNIGNSIGISVVVALLARNTQTYRSVLTESVNAFSHSAQVFAESVAAKGSAAAIGLLDREINRQAAMAGYLDDFILMAWVTLATAPIVFLLRRPRLPGAPGGTPAYET
jgi:DHA2 family multidrug resistance protein